MSFANGAGVSTVVGGGPVVASQWQLQQNVMADAGQTVTDPAQPSTEAGYDFSKWGAQNINRYGEFEEATPTWARSDLVSDGNGDYGRNSDGDYFNENGGVIPAHEVTGVLSSESGAGGGGGVSKSKTFVGGEQERYDNAGRNDPRWADAVKNSASTADKFDDAIAAHPEMLGQLNDRAFRAGDDTKAYQGDAVGAYYNAQLKALGLQDTAGMSASQKASGENWTNYMSASAQDARAPKPSMGGFSLVAGLALSAFLGPQMMAMLAAQGVGAVAAGAMTGATIGGVTSAISGGDPFKGAVLGGLGGAVGGFASTLEGGANFIGPTQGGVLSTSNLVNAGGRALVAGASGGNPLVAGASSLSGSAVGNATGSKIAGTIAGTGAGLIGSNLTGSNRQATIIPAVAASTANTSNTNVNDWIHSLGTSTNTGPVKFANVGLLNR